MRYRFLRFPGGKFKAVTFSYDDGVVEDIRLAEIFNKYNMRGTFNINSNALTDSPSERKLGADKLREHLLDRGHEIAVHGDTHLASGAGRPIECIRDALVCREKLENIFGMIIRGMAYPDSGIRNFHNCNDYETVKKSLESLDIVYSRTLGGDNNSFKLPEDWHAWMPTMHHKNENGAKWIEEFLALEESKFRTASRYPRLFYIWGHSYEFDRANNWELIESICEKLANKEDTWYATNIEIYEYVKAYESLVYSADCKRIYNPTLKKIWFDVDGVPYSIESGETIYIQTEGKM